jgi:hypothetical protein
MSSSRFAAGLVLTLCATGVLAQTTYIWRGPTPGEGGPWETAANWNPAGVPGLPGDTAGITTNPGQVVTLASRPIIRRLTLSGGLTLLPSSALYFIENVTITSGAIRVGNGGPGSDAVLAPIAGTGTITAAGGDLFLDADPAGPSNARVLAPSGGAVVLVGNTRGRGVIQGDGTVFNSGNIIGENQGLRVLGSIAQQPSARLTGVIALDNATVVGGLIAAGVSIAPGSTAEFRDVTLLNPFSIESDSTLRVAGPLKGAGKLLVGSGAASAGGLVLTDQAELAVNLASPTRVEIEPAGSVTLAGTLRIVSRTPEPRCAQWTIISFHGPSTSTPISGRFRAALGTPAIGFRFALQQGPRSVVLRHTCAGDFNFDCEVDFNDLLAFLNLYALGDPDADLNNDGGIDFNDFLAFLNLYNAGC